MILSSKTTLKFSNKNKLENIHTFVSEYRRIVIYFVDVLWKMDKVPVLIPIDITSKVTTWLSARAIQCAAKQASGIVRGTRTKQNRRLFQIEKLKETGHYKHARKLQTIYNNVVITKPNIQSIKCELDERFVKIDFLNKTSFDGWITLSSLGNKLKIVIPIKRNKHFNSLFLSGKIKNGIRLSETDVTFMFDIEDAKQKNYGNVLGIDIGQKTTLSCSDGTTVNEDIHGHSYSSICDKLKRKKKGSKNFMKVQRHRSNYLHWCVNQINLENVKTVNREDIKHLRKFSRCPRKLGHWNYAELFDVLDFKLEKLGVQVIKLNPTYTSQRCSHCGWVRKKNRNGKRFKCEKCSYEQDADLNASINISLGLIPIGKQERLKHKNRIGFYWNASGEEPIVPRAQKT